MAGAAKQQHYVEQTITAEAAAYATGDLIGGAVIELVGAVPGDAGQAGSQGGIIQSVIITDLAAQTANIDVVFFDANPTNTAFLDNSAFDVHDTDLRDVIGVVAITDWKSFSTNSIGQAMNVVLPFTLDSGSTLYAALISRGAPTFASTTDLSLRVGILDS